MSELKRLKELQDQLRKRLADIPVENQTYSPVKLFQLSGAAAIRHLQLAMKQIQQELGIQETVSPFVGYKLDSNLLFVYSFVHEFEPKLITNKIIVPDSSKFNHSFRLKEYLGVMKRNIQTKVPTIMGTNEFFYINLPVSIQVYRIIQTTNPLASYVEYLTQTNSPLIILSYYYTQQLYNKFNFMKDSDSIAELEILKNALDLFTTWMAKTKEMNIVNYTTSIKDSSLVNYINDQFKENKKAAA